MLKPCSQPAVSLASLSEGDHHRTHWFSGGGQLNTSENSRLFCKLPNTLHSIWRTHVHTVHACMQLSYDGCTQPNIMQLLYAIM